MKLTCPKNVMYELILLTDGSVNAQLNIGYGAYLAVSERGVLKGTCESDEIWAYIFNEAGIATFIKSIVTPVKLGVQKKFPWKLFITTIFNNTS